jgi:hypothetical protein
MVVSKSDKPIRLQSAMELTATANRLKDEYIELDRKSELLVAELVLRMKSTPLLFS